MSSISTDAPLTLLVAFWACGCVFMAIDATDARSASLRASWETRGYRVATMTKAAYIREGVPCGMHDASEETLMSTEHAREFAMIYRGIR